ncbi:hypothetical protein C6Y45_14355 [Alkalicoccus saliphilus]|uniref:Uncharacterized protein n=1 Tax=Alkalicoccus saliphilus TaxID=200989 RepID=A0A2T4U375_9BACI|nr:hypothetical protein C6Y45_14355 [Alkalicoccus saliphilus]
MIEYDKLFLLKCSGNADCCCVEPPFFNVSRQSFTSEAVLYGEALDFFPTHKKNRVVSQLLFKKKQGVSSIIAC